MERFCVSHDRHRLGCDVEMVQSNVGEWVGYDDASAEIAKLRAEVERIVIASKNGNDSLRTEIASLERLRDELRSDLSAARAALDGEREALAVICDEQASLAKRDRCHAEAVTLHQIAVMIRARRAAEAITIPPNRTGTPEESQAIADWHHDEINRRAAEAQPKE